MAAPVEKRARTAQELPETKRAEISVGVLSGKTIWGPKIVAEAMLVGELSKLLERPIGCPRVTLVSGEQVLEEGDDVSALPFGTRLTANFAPPAAFDHEFVRELCSLACEHEYDIVGGYMSGSQLKPEAVTVPWMKVLQVVLNDAEVQLKLRVPRRKLSISAEGTATLQIKCAVLSWLDYRLHQESDSDGEPKSDGEVVPVKDLERTVELIQNDDAVVEVLDISEDFATVNVSLSWETEGDDDFHGVEDVVIRTPIDDLVDAHAQKRAFECIDVKLGATPDPLMAQLNALIDRVKVQEPDNSQRESLAAQRMRTSNGSDCVVRDIVHPSLFPYVKHLSKITEGLSKEDAAVVAESNKPGKEKRDMWGRAYEQSNYQWLPAEVFVGGDGQCEFESYINNLSREKYAGLYAAIGELFSLCLPHFEAVYSPRRTLMFLDGEVGWEPDSDLGDEDVEEVSLRGRRLQVIVKVVDYELAPGQTHEGVWHVEGMSHENIVATAEVVLQKDAQLKGGDLGFKRAFTRDEARCMSSRFPQCRPSSFDKFVDTGFCPLGKLALELGQITAWSNSHVQKLSPLANTGDKQGTCRSVVFWLVDPDQRIVSSAMVPPQQGAVPLEQAKQWRTKLTRERTKHTQSARVG